MNEEVLTKAELVQEEFLKLYDEFDVTNAPEKRKADIIDSFWEDIFEVVFKPKPGEKCFNQMKTKFKTHDVVEVESVCNMYIKLCRRYGGVLKKESFSELTGVHRSTYSLWHQKNKSNGFIFKLSDTDLLEESKEVIYVLKDSGVDIIYNGNGKYMSSDNTKILSSMRFDAWKKIEYAINGENTNDLRNSPNGAAIRANWDTDVKKGYGKQAYMDKIEAVVETTERKLPRLSNWNCTENTDNLLTETTEIIV